jgi:cbb3-type cytochrome oxidase maturation protein
MNIIYVLIPLSLLLMVLAIGFFFWAVKNDQFDDLDTPALDILDDDHVKTNAGTTEDTEDTEKADKERQS